VPTYDSRLFLGFVMVAGCHQMIGPATYRQQDCQRIRQVSGWEAISGLKSGLFLLQQHHLDGLGKTWK